MPTFAPVYRPPTSQQSWLTREQKRERKRRRAAEDDEDDEDDERADEHSPRTEDDDVPRVPHPVNRTDPYYVAGHPREQPLPGGNFPHAPARQVKPAQASVEEELASLNPPLYVPKTTPQDDSGSFRRRHLDNLTAILHKCMLNGDWHRASRAWALILRTEIGGHGIDIRHNGRWLVGAELLLRQSQKIVSQEDGPPASSAENDVEASRGDVGTTAAVSDEGFKLARDYYERMILQYPHLPRAHQGVVNALAIYPALFNIWTYEVQDRAQRAQAQISGEDSSSVSDSGSMSGRSDASDALERKRNIGEIRSLEVAQALQIAQRMDEVMLNPPYDASSELLHSRGMVALWLANLHKDLATFYASSLEGTSSSDEEQLPHLRYESRASKKRHDEQAVVERQKARRVFEKMTAAKMAVPAFVSDFLSSDEDSSMLDDNQSG